MPKLPQMRILAIFTVGIPLLALLGGCDDSPNPAVANPQATASTFIEAIRTGNEDAAAETVLDAEELARTVAASTAARLELEEAYNERFGGSLSDDVNLTLVRLARQPERVQEGNLELEGDVALLDVGDGRRLRFELEDDEWRLDLPASLGLEGDDAIEQSIENNRANARKWSAVAGKIRSGAYGDKDEVVSALMDSAASSTVGNPEAAD